jgi:hypothetical protein
MKAFIAVAVASILLAAVVIAVYPVEAKSKTAEIRANLHGLVPYTCLDHPELYVRISDSAANPKTGEHDKLVGKITIDNPSKQEYKIKIKVDPKKAPSGLLREYIQILQHDASGKDQIVWQEYSHPYSPLSAKEYKWKHSVPSICQ